MSPAANARPAARPRAGARAIRTRAPISTREAATSTPSQIATAYSGGLAVGLGRAHEREREQEQSGHARDDRDLLAAREATRVAVCAEDRERRDPRRADALHERQRGEPKRREIEDPAGRLDAEAHEPGSAVKQQADGLHGTAHRQFRHTRDGVVLRRVRPVDRDRGEEREDEAAGERHRERLRRAQDLVVDPARSS